MNRTAEQRYTELATLRNPFLVRARAAAALTVPTLMPPDGHSPNMDLPTPYQSVGARGLNNLAVRMLLAMLPPNSPFFKLQVDDFVLSELTGREDMRGQIEEGLSSIERAVQGEIEASAIRVPAFEMLKQLLNAGNVLLHFPKKGGMRVFRLDTYVCKRDPLGNVLEIILKETVAVSTLPEDIRALVDSSVHQGEKKNEGIREVDIYTYIQRRTDKWEVWQEVKGQRLGNTYGMYPMDRCPWLALRFTRIDGEDYGRGYVEQYIGDLRSLEGLTRSIVEGSAAAAKVLFLIKPNSTTRARTIARLPNGGIGEGDANDVTTLQMQKYADFKVAFDTITRIEQRLEFAFLLTSAIQRSGERVTAEEIRRVASDLEVALGGVYALLSQEFQLPLVHLLMTRMQSEKRLPKLPKERIKPSIVTGLEALGRGNDNERLMGALQDLAPVLDVLKPRLKAENLAKRVFASRQVDAKDLLMTDEEFAAKQQQDQMLQMVHRLGPQAVTQLGGIARDAAASGEQPAPEAPTQ
jgi:hypothetical protein